jgi:hypothetical protein
VYSSAVQCFHRFINSSPEHVRGASTGPQTDTHTHTHTHTHRHTHTHAHTHTRARTHFKDGQPLPFKSRAIHPIDQCSIITIGLHTRIHTHTHTHTHRHTYTHTHTHTRIFRSDYLASRPFKQGYPSGRSSHWPRQYYYTRLPRTHIVG